MSIVVLLYIMLIFIFIQFLFFASTTLISIILFTGDKFMIFIAAAYLSHQNFSIKFASGNAVYFWNIVGGLIAVGIYTYLFRRIYARFGLIGKLVNFAISYLSVLIVYSVTINIFMGKNILLLPLLNNELANNIVNYIIVAIIASFVWVKREESLQQIDF